MMLVVALAVCAVVVVTVVLFEKFHKPVEAKAEKVLDVVKSDVAAVKDEAGEVKAAAEDVKKDLSK